MNGIIYKWYHKYTYLSVNTVSLSGGESERLVQQPTSQQHEWKCEIFSTGTSRSSHRRDVGCSWVNEPPCSVCNYSTVFGVRFLYSYFFFFCPHSSYSFTFVVPFFPTDGMRATAATTRDINNRRMWVVSSFICSQVEFFFLFFALYSLKKLVKCNKQRRR